MNNNAKRITYNIIEAVLTIAIFFVSIMSIVMLIFNCVYVKTYVVGYSMQPTLNASVSSISECGDLVYVNELRTPTKGEVVVANVNWAGYTSVVKRLIGTEGDMIRMTADDDYVSLYVNEQLIISKDLTISSEHFLGGTFSYYQKFVNYINDDINILKGTVVENEAGQKCILVKEGQAFLMGDNWGESSDSLEFGAIDFDDIVGNVEIIVRQNDDSILSLFKSIFAILFN